MSEEETERNNNKKQQKFLIVAEETTNQGERKKIARKIPLTIKGNQGYPFVEIDRDGVF